MGIQLGSFATNFTNRRIIADAHNERKKIAARLNITERIVKAHLDSIYHKLGVDSRAAAVE